MKNHRSILLVEKEGLRPHADLQELAAVNAKRPYFLLVHIREYSDLQRTKNILDRLGPEYEVIPLDLFLKFAGMEPTFEERFLEK